MNEWICSEGHDQLLHHSFTKHSNILWGSSTAMRKYMLTWSPMTTRNNDRRNIAMSVRGHFNSGLRKNSWGWVLFFDWSLYDLLWDALTVLWKTAEIKLFSPKTERSQLLWMSLVTFTLTVLYIVPLCWLSGPKIWQITEMKESRSESNPVIK